MNFFEITPYLLLYAVVVLFRILLLSFLKLLSHLTNSSLWALNEGNVFSKSDDQILSSMSVSSSMAIGSPCLIASRLPIFLNCRSADMPSRERLNGSSKSLDHIYHPVADVHRHAFSAILNTSAVEEANRTVSLYGVEIVYLPDRISSLVVSP